MNTTCLLQSKWSPKGVTLALQETQSIHDSMNIPKIEFIAYSGADMWKNRALYDKSMKLGTWPG